MSLSAHSETPQLGDETNVARACTRYLGRNDDGSERLCLKQPVIHVDWGEATGYVCAEHAQDALDRGWRTEDSHELGACCGMLGARWFTATWEGAHHSWCAIPGDGADVAEPVRAVALEVPRVAS